MTQSVNIQTHISLLLSDHELISSSGDGFGKALEESTMKPNGKVNFPQVLGKNVLSFLNQQEHANIRNVSKKCSKDFKLLKNKAQCQGLMQSCAESANQKNSTLSIGKTFGDHLASFFTLKDRMSMRNVSKSCSRDSATKVTAQDLMNQAAVIEDYIQSNGPQIHSDQETCTKLQKLSIRYLSDASHFFTAAKGHTTETKEISVNLRNNMFWRVKEAIGVDTSRAPNRIVLSFGGMSTRFKFRGYE